VSRQVQDLLNHNFIEPTHGVWSSPVVLVKNKDGSRRFSLDYHRLNSVTIQDANALLQINESLDALAGSKHFSTLDMLSGTSKCPSVLMLKTKQHSSPITGSGNAFLCHSDLRLPQQLSNNSWSKSWKTLLIYLDDIIVISPDFTTHVSCLRKVFNCLLAAGLK